jgi:curved DNA-binding protein CbpA
VRRAYRNLARLLHPDQQSDETLRRLAGIQMARLNEILDTLIDPKLRRVYDDRLRWQAIEAARERMRAPKMAQSGADLPFGNPRSRSRLAWPIAGLAGIGLIALFLGQEIADQRQPTVQESNVSARTLREPESGAWPGRRGERLAPSKRQTEGDAGNSSASNPEILSGDTDVQKPTSSGIDNDASIAADGWNTGQPDRLLAGGFGGQWYYAKPATLGDLGGMCPPVYVDMEISESLGTVTGKYSARYVVGERMISPFVKFEFAGPVREPKANLEWTGPGGAAGWMRLTLLSARALQVEWSANTIGKEMGLGSGTAMLVRRESR